MGFFFSASETASLELDFFLEVNEIFMFVILVLGELTVETCCRADAGLFV